MKLNGYYVANERFADNRQVYENALAAGEKNALNMTPEELESRLDLFDRFPPGEPHSRMIAHKIEVYNLSAPRWEQHGKRLLIPKGSLEHIITMDFGDEIKKACGLNTEEVLEENARYELLDGSVIIGKRVRTTSYAGKIDSRKMYSEWFEVIFDQSNYAKQGYFHYELRIKTEEFTPSNVREYHITSYVKINDETIQQKKQFARPLFKLNDNDHLGPIPIKFVRFRCSTIR